MKRETYDFFWRKVFLPQITMTTDELIQRYRADEKYHLRTKNLEECREKIFSDYEKNRDDLKQRFFFMKPDEEKKEHLIDIHKIAACFCKSALQNKMFLFDMREDIPTELFLCNYTIAYTISVGIMYENLLGEYKKALIHDAAAGEKYEILRRQGRFIMPETNPGHDSYAIGRIKTLALNEIYGIDFDILTYSDMMYWIERYNKELLEKQTE